MSKKAGSENPQGGDKKLGFNAAMEELTAIVQRIEEDQTDIDGLAAALHRASQLLEFCRGKIRKVDLEVSQIVEQLDGEENGSDDDVADG